MNSITIPMPFEWCSECSEIELESSKFYGDFKGKTGFVNHKCVHEAQCRKLVAVRERYEEKIKRAIVDGIEKGLADLKGEEQ